MSMSATRGHDVAGDLQHRLLQALGRGGVRVVAAVVGLGAVLDADDVELGLVNRAGREREVRRVLRADLLAERLQQQAGEKRDRRGDGLVDVELGLLQGHDNEAVGPLVQVHRLGSAGRAVLRDGVLAQVQGVFVDRQQRHVAVQGAELHALVGAGRVVVLDGHLLALVVALVVVQVDDGALLVVVAGAVVGSVVVVVAAEADDLDLALGRGGAAARAVVRVHAALIDGDALERAVVVVLLERRGGGHAAAGRQQRALVGDRDAGDNGAQGGGEHLHGCAAGGVVSGETCG